PSDVDVVVAVEVGVDTTLETHLGGPFGGGFAHPLGDVVEREQIRRTPQVERERTLGEPTEPAFEGAHVRVIDVAVVYERDNVADGFTSKFVGQRGHGGHLTAPGSEQGEKLV